jgi:hypothetical protein
VKSFVLKAAGLMVLAVLAVGAAAPAHASHISIKVVEPTPAIAGQVSELDAALTSADTGQPVAGVSVTFLAHGSFDDVSGYMEIGHAVTNSEGIAAISYAPRETGTHDIRVEYASPAGGTTEEATASIAVEGSAGQIYVQTAGIQVPGLNSWLIIGLLSVIWGTLFFVAVAVIRIARAGGSGVLSVQRASLATAMAPSRTLDRGGAGSGR